MKKNSKIIICIIAILIFIIIMILCALFYIKSINEENNNNTQTIDENEYIDGELEGKEVEIESNRTLSKLITKNDYYTLIECTRIYQDAINNLIDNNNQENQQKLLNMLDDEYIQQENVTNLNYTKSEMYIDEILKTQLSNKVSAYYINGKLRNINDSQISEYDMILKIDFGNNTFSVYPYEYIINNQMQQLSENSVINISIVQEITDKVDNKFQNQTNRYRTITIPYFEKMKSDLLYDQENIYNLLDDEYKEKKFGNIDSFKNYIELNRETFSNMEIQKYARYYYDGYTQYVALDNFGNYYVFNETSTMNYKVLLDTYTIDQPEFIEKYDSASDVEKAGYDIDKFMTAINTKDYNYAYNHLAQSFKQNNFTTLESFINYIQNNFYSNNECEITNGQKEGNYYVYTVNISNANQENSGITQKNFVVNLKENREYELSFNIE